MPDPPLLDTLRRTIAERSLIRPGERVLVAVSGGADSLALLHALHALCEGLGIELVAAHLNHRMRGAAGEADAAFVRATAAAWGVPAEIGARDVPRLARRAGLSLEEAGREARYRFLGRAARRTGCTAIATAHTADDRAETVLLHLFRGTGLDGLAGFPAERPLRPSPPAPLPKTAGRGAPGTQELCSTPPLPVVGRGGRGVRARAPLRVIRPFIDVTRAQVLAYCASHGLEPRHDATNDSPDFLRNRLRHDLLPLLEREYSPALRRHLLRLARLAEEETALLDAQATALLAAATEANTKTQRHEDDAKRSFGRSDLALSRTVLQDAPPALARRALRLAVQAVQPGPPPELATVERLLTLLRGEATGFTLPGGRIAARVTPKALILAPVAVVPPFDEQEPVPLAVPGVTPLPWGAGIITAEALGVGGWALGAGSELLSPNPQPPTPDTALLDRASLIGPLVVRPPQPGDRIQPLGMVGHRKLQDLLTDRKVPRAARRRVPVVCDDERIVWVAGHCVSEAVKITEATTELVRLVWESTI